MTGDRALLDNLLKNSELDLQDAKNELRWMRQSLSPDLSMSSRDSELLFMINRRAAGEPLQYILGALHSLDVADLQATLTLAL